MLATATTRQAAPDVPLAYTADMAKRRIVSVRKARATLSERLDAAQYHGEHSIMFRHSEVAAIMVPPKWYHAACQALGDPWEDWQPPPPESAPDES